MNYSFIGRLDTETPCSSDSVARIQRVGVFNFLHFICSNKIRFQHF